MRDRIRCRIPVRTAVHEDELLVGNELPHLRLAGLGLVPPPPREEGPVRWAGSPKRPCQLSFPPSQPPRHAKHRHPPPQTYISTSMNLRFGLSSSASVTLSRMYCTSYCRPKRVLQAHTCARKEAASTDREEALGRAHVRGRDVPHSTRRWSAALCSPNVPHPTACEQTAQSLRVKGDRPGSIHPVSSWLCACAKIPPEASEKSQNGEVTTQ